MPGSIFQLEVNPRIPARLARLEELVMDLWYSWEQPARQLLARLDGPLYEACGRSPRAFLKRVDQRLLDAAADDPVFIGEFNRVLGAYDDYLSRNRRVNGAQRLADDDLIAYFCSEYGFHDSLPIFSGGLGILAGDHCKAASDMRLPLVGVGLLYRQGYFRQTLDVEGHQQATYSSSEFEELPIREARDAHGNALRVTVELGERTIAARIWQARAGHVSLVLLDTDVEENSERDRGITHRLYGGDRTTRIEQEIVLGMGGVRALDVLQLAPTVWHINEGHAAFMVLERARTLMARGLDFSAALEAVSANTVFTTHTPVPAGHDHFSGEMIDRYFSAYARATGLAPGALFALGKTPASPDFNMTALAIRGTRYHNGVSRIHGGVTAKMLAGLWPEIEPEENPIEYVTNGVHLPTVLARDWHDLFDRFLGFGWMQRVNDPACWQAVNQIPDHLFWSLHQSLKSQLFQSVRRRIMRQHARYQGSQAHLDRLLRYADPETPNVLTIGFARRFAHYKRATLVFDDLEWLREILCHPERPAMLIFAGKAHPADGPGQDLIRRVAEVSRMREFEGRILLVEGYDLHLGRRLVAGCDVWLNNPQYPLEASGTSGMKAAMNGVMNLSVLDGWWDEGYDGANGWAIKPAYHLADEGRRNHEEARTLYELLQDHVVPLYYDRGPTGFSPRWVAMAKRSIASLATRFSALRMVGQYVDNFYLKAARRGREMTMDDCAAAKTVAAWKARVRSAWSGVQARRLDTPPRRLPFGTSFRIEVAVALNGLAPEDVTAEIIMERAELDAGDAAPRAHRLAHVRKLEGSHEDLFALDLAPEHCGSLRYRVRLYPAHRLLTHRFELGMMRWL
jgi:starch phosphorylase